MVAAAAWAVALVAWAREVWAMAAAGRAMAG